MTENALSQPCETVFLTKNALSQPCETVFLTEMPLSQHFEAMSEDKTRLSPPFEPPVEPPEPVLEPFYTTRLTMKIDSIHTNNLRNDVHFQFFTDFQMLVDRYGAASLKVKPQYDVFVPLFHDEDIALKKINKSVLTAEIQEADRWRDELWRGMVDANKSALRHFDEAVRKAAAQIKIVFDTYGNIAVKPLDEETSAVYNVLEDLKLKYNDDALLVGLDRWMIELRKANDRFKALMAQRYDESAGKTALVLKQCRAKVDDVYRTIIERINAYIVIEGEQTWAEFVTTFNKVIKRYNDILAQQKGRRKAANGEEPVASE